MHRACPGRPEGAVEPDERVRATLAGLALVFAEFVDRADAWKENLEGGNVLKSKVVEEWRQSARVETSQESLLAFLEERFGTLPEELVQRIQAVTDLPRLKGAIRKVVHLQSLDQFQL